MKRRLSSVLICAVAAATAQTSNDVPPQLRNIKIDQKLDSQVPLDTKFRDENGREVSLRSLFRGKPVLLTLVYYNCPRLCSMVLTGSLKAMRAMPLTAGREFDVITLSFDPRETPELARQKKASYLEGYGRAEASQGWHFLTGDAQEIERLTRSVGFGFEYDPKTDGFAHASALIVLTPRGRVSRYFYGVEFPPRDVRWGLVDAADGKIGSLADQVLLYCFHYDPETGRYSVAIVNTMRLFGVLTVAVIAVFLIANVRRERRRKFRVPVGV